MRMGARDQLLETGYDLFDCRALGWIDIDLSVRAPEAGLADVVRTVEKEAMSRTVERQDVPVKIRNGTTASARIRMLKGTGQHRGVCQDCLRIRLQARETFRQIIGPLR